ncbi:hypothetical protein Hanom_Chr03g00179151 [Helianthus anomalus]
MQQKEQTSYCCLYQTASPLRVEELIKLIPVSTQQYPIASLKHYFPQQQQESYPAIPNQL